MARKVKPMLATLYKKEPFDDPEWIFEKKFDGIRCICLYDKKTCTLLSRNNNEISSQYPEIVEDAVKLSKKSFLIDGELVTQKGTLGSFERMQKRSHVQKPSKKLLQDYPVAYFVFDILEYDGKNLKKKPLKERKEILKKLSYTKRIHYTDHQEKTGISFVKKMKRLHYEGAIAKKKSSHYLATRSKKWLKLKCENEQEFVVGGFTDPRKSRKGFGALLVGVYKDSEFIYCGKVGTGYDEDTLKKLKKKLVSLKRKDSPFSEKSPKERATIHWVTPKLVVQVRFTEWTDEGKLRHPSYLGLRTDKNPKNVTK